MYGSIVQHSIHRSRAQHSIHLQYAQISCTDLVQHSTHCTVHIACTTHYTLYSMYRSHVQHSMHCTVCTDPTLSLTSQVKVKKWYQTLYQTEKRNRSQNSIHQIHNVVCKYVHMSSIYIHVQYAILLRIVNMVSMVYIRM